MASSKRGRNVDDDEDGPDRDAPRDVDVADAADVAAGGRFVFRRWDLDNVGMCF